MEFGQYESGIYGWVRMTPYFIDKNVMKNCSGWQINLARDLTLVYPDSPIRQIIQLTEEQLKYALNLLRKAKKGKLKITGEG